MAYRSNRSAASMAVVEAVETYAVWKTLETTGIPQWVVREAYLQHVAAAEAADEEVDKAAAAA